MIAQVLPGRFVMGLGFGFTASPTLIAAQSSVPWNERGVVTGTNAFARSIGSAVGIAIANDWMRAQGTAVTRYAQVTAFVNVNAVPMDTERVLEDWTVVVGDGKIIATGPAAATPVPEGATTIDGSGRYLLPGLTEMHGHIPPPASSDPAYVESVLYLYVANGVTTVRGMQGAPGQLELRERSARNEIVAPTLAGSTRALTEQHGVPVHRRARPSLGATSRARRMPSRA